MKESEILEIHKGTLEIKPMTYVGEEGPEERRYYIQEYCGTVILDENGTVIKRVPNIPGKPRCKTFMYAGPYMLIGDTIYYNGKATKYHCNEMYYHDSILECQEDCNKYFLMNGKPLRRLLFRRINTGYKLDLITILQKNGVCRLWLGGLNTNVFLYGKVNGLHFHKCGPIARWLNKRMQLDDTENIA